MSKSNIKQ